MGENAQLRQQLLLLASRIERLRQEPRRAPTLWTRLRAPVYRLLGFRPQFSVEHITALIEEVCHLRRKRALPELEALALSLEQNEDPLPALFASALSELADNVALAELGTEVRARFPASQVLWLDNMVAVLLRLWPLIDDTKNAWERRFAEAVSLASIAPPLDSLDPSAPIVSGTAAGQLASIDALMEAARREIQSLDRRRRLLEAAREMLINANASLKLNPSAALARHNSISDDLLDIARFQAAGISPGVRLSHQVREAYQRGEWSRLHAGLVAFERFSLRGGDRRAGEAAYRGLDQVWGDSDRFALAHVGESSLKSVKEIFGEDTSSRLLEGIARAQSDYAGPNASDKVRELDPNDLGFALRHVESLDVAVYLNGLLAVDGCFDVGGILTPTRVVEESVRTRAVRFPTAQLTLTHAEGPQDIRDAVIEDPRTIVADLAAGKLLTRRFIRQERVKQSRTVMLGELRIYLLDGSTSMLTPRSVLRDAILIAELCTLIARLNDAGRNVNPTLYYQYFAEQVGPVTEITTAEEATGAICELLETVQTGGTDIQAAILHSIEQIRHARDAGMDLARANIVLVTDGESAIDADEIVARLGSLGDLETGINIIALGVENPSLRELAAHQKALGRRVFYQFIDDVTIRKIINGERDAVCLHPPSAVELEGCATLLAETVAELQDIDDDPDASCSDIHLEQALAEMDADDALRDALRGRIDVAKRDRDALRRRFQRWFPAESRAKDAASKNLVAPSRSVVHQPGNTTAARIEDVLGLLQAVTEVSALMVGDPREIAADALEIFQRSLYDAGISPFQYSQLLERFPERFAEALAQIHECVALSS